MMTFELLLPLDFFLGQLRCGKFKLSDEFQIDFNLLHTVAVYLFGSVNNDLVDKFVYHHCGQLREVGVPLGKFHKLLHTGGVFFKRGQPLLRIRNRRLQGFLLRFVFGKQAAERFCPASL